MKYLFFLIAFSLFFNYGLSQSIGIELFATGLNKPVNIKHAGDDRLFVIEQDGRIRIITVEGNLLTTPFLDINSRVVDIGGIGDERGLLGLAFHPNYNNNGYFYLNYINNSGQTVVSRFQRFTNDIADPNSELILLTIPQPFANHNGGDMAFGPDGFLYISSGDGGSSGDPLNNSQNISNLLGKILRIDVDNPSNGNNYGIPSTNPFVGNPSGRNEIWVYGLRNPWKFSFDFTNNDIWIADVGQNEIEEINTLPIATSSANFGWRCFEGNTAFNNTNCPPQNLLTFPVATYNHFDGAVSRCSITGGYRYRGSAQPSLFGLYFFADFCSQEIGYLREVNNTWEINFTSALGHNWVAFGEDVNGELYAASIVQGSIFRIIDNNLSVNEFDIDKLSLHPNPATTEVNFSVENERFTISEIQVFDLLGKQVLKIENISESNYRLDTAEMAKGLYLTKITTNTKESKILKLLIN